MNANNKRRRTAALTNDVPVANPVASWHRANNLVGQAPRKLQSTAIGENRRSFAINCKWKGSCCRTRRRRSAVRAIAPTVGRNVRAWLWTESKPQAVRNARSQLRTGAGEIDRGKVTPTFGTLLEGPTNSRWRVQVTANFERSEGLRGRTGSLRWIKHSGFGASERRPMADGEASPCA